MKEKKRKDLGAMRISAMLAETRSLYSNGCLCEGCVLLVVAVVMFTSTTAATK